MHTTGTVPKNNDCHVSTSHSITQWNDHHHAIISWTVSRQRKIAWPQVRPLQLPADVSLWRTCVLRGWLSFIDNALVNGNSIQNTPINPQQMFRITTRMYYRSGTDGRCCSCARQTLRFYSPTSRPHWRQSRSTFCRLRRQCGRAISDSTAYAFLCEMTSWPPFWNYDVKSKIRLISRCVGQSTVSEQHSRRSYHYSAVKLFSKCSNQCDQGT